MTQSSSAIFKENHVFNYKFLKIAKNLKNKNCMAKKLVKSKTAKLIENICDIDQRRRAYLPNV